MYKILLHLISLSLSLSIFFVSNVYLINSVVQRNSVVFHLELRSSDVYIIILYAVYAQPTPLTKMTTTTMERSRRRCGLVCERVTARVYKRQRRQVGDTTHLFYSAVQCVRMLRARGHTLIIITLGTRRDEISITPGPARCRIATLPPTQQSILYTRLRCETHVRVRKN